MNSLDNLKPFKTGYDERREGNGNKKGTKHLSTHIQELLNDEEFTAWIPDAREGFKEFKGAPMKAILRALAIKAAKGDVKAFDALAKYGYGQKIDITTKGESIKAEPDPTLAAEFTDWLKNKK